jgi:hypothetical protein
VRDFIQGIIDSSKRLEAAHINDSIFVEYRMSLINEKRVNNADIVAAINNVDPQTATFAVVNAGGSMRLTDDANAKEIRLTEEDLYSKIFTEEYSTVTAEARRRFKDFKLGARFHEIMRELKKDATLHRVKYLDPNNPRSLKKDWYSKKVYEELAKFYEPKPVAMSQTGSN